jgi:hypothetical protein
VASLAVALFSNAVLLVGAADAAPSKWKHIYSPDPSTGAAALFSVDCTSTTNCVAVGQTSSPTNFSVQYPLVETWDGNAWSVRATSPAGHLGYLYGVSCLSAYDCFAVGFVIKNSGDETLILSSQNGSWKVIPSPNMGTGSKLFSVACVKASSTCVVVGFYVNASDVIETLVETWNGTNWSVTPSPDVADAPNQLLGVSCVNASDCFAVGYLPSDSGPSLIESWNGSVWSIVPSPDPSSIVNALDAVSCASAHSCVAVGTFGDDTTSMDESLIMTWDGTTWTTSSPEPDGTYSELLGVSCVSSKDCVADGDYETALRSEVTSIQTCMLGPWS